MEHRAGVLVSFKDQQNVTSIQMRNGRICIESERRTTYTNGLESEAVSSNVSHYRVCNFFETTNSGGDLITVYEKEGEEGVLKFAAEKLESMMYENGVVSCFDKRVR